MTATIPPAVWVHGRSGSWMIVPLDAGRYLSLTVEAGAGAPKPWQATVELCGPDDDVIDRRQVRAPSPLEARVEAVKAARALRRTP